MNMWSRAALQPPVTNHAAGEPEVILDLSRLLSRVLHATPTGVDRVEMAYARELLARIPDHIRFAAVHPLGLYGRLPTPLVQDFLDETEQLWSGSATAGGKMARRMRSARRLLALRPRRLPRAAGGTSRVYLQASPHHLARPDLVARILRRERARFVCLVHDLIPIEFPEYARPGGDATHRRRMDTLGLHADALIANSEATKTALERYLAPSGRVPPIVTALLGTHVQRAEAPPPPTDIPYFVCVSTIEPRKNHILLLQMWRRLAEELKPGEVLPKLVLIGRRGWENENVIDMLERSPLLQEHVIEANSLPDSHAADLVRGARALLLPSFAEGYGMPVAEALEMHVPVICSDLPALREVGRDVPEYLDPLHGPAWISAVRHYSAPDSARRQLQLKRMRSWRTPQWRDHLSLVLDCCRAVAAA